METMMTEKWMISFKLVDFNRDGTINVKDRDECIQSFLSEYKPEGGKEDTMRNRLNAFWDKIVFLGKEPDWSKSYSAEEFLATRKDAYTNDSAKTLSVVREALKQLVSAGNVDESGSLSYEEFKALHDAFNLKDENFTKVIFSLIGADGSGKCSVDNIADFFTELGTGSDEEKHGQYKAALASVGFV